MQNSLSTADLGERNFKMKLSYLLQSACRHLYLSVRQESSTVIYERNGAYIQYKYTWNKNFYTTTTSNINRLLNPW